MPKQAAACSGGAVRPGKSAAGGGVSATSSHLHFSNRLGSPLHLSFHRALQQAGGQEDSSEWAAQCTTNRPSALQFTILSSFIRRLEQLAEHQ